MGPVPIFAPCTPGLRGGTVLHKVHLAPPARYSEDIDLVATSARPEAQLRKALTRALGEVLGKPARSAWGALSLAVRNAARHASSSVDGRTA